jgi:hypothetical protein
MPQGGVKLPDAQINLIRQWISDGLLEKSIFYRKDTKNAYLVAIR